MLEIEVLSPTERLKEGILKDKTVFDLSKYDVNPVLNMVKREDPRRVLETHIGLLLLFAFFLRLLESLLL